MDKIIIAIPRGRIIEECKNILNKTSFAPDPLLFDESSRKLTFSSSKREIQYIKVRSFDVCTFVAFGAAHFGVAGNDVLTEFDYPEIYAPVDLGIGKCRLSVAAPEAIAMGDDPSRWSHIRIATKYPEITKRHFANRGVQAECIKLHGAIEIAPSLGLCRRIVDLVSTGETLRANGLVEVEQISEITSRLAINRTAMKTRPVEMNHWIDRFREVVDDINC